MHRLTTYRRLVAHLLHLWIWMIIGSGVVFIHKEITSDGTVVIHNHPYDFTKKTKHQHNTDDEIHFLDIVFQRVFVKADSLVFQTPIRDNYSILSFPPLIQQYIQQNLDSPSTRGPPALFA